MTIHLKLAERISHLTFLS